MQGWQYRGHDAGQQFDRSIDPLQRAAGRVLHSTSPGTYAGRSVPFLGRSWGLVRQIGWVSRFQLPRIVTASGTRLRSLLPRGTPTDGTDLLRSGLLDLVWLWLASWLVRLPDLLALFQPFGPWRPENMRSRLLDATVLGWIVVRLWMPESDKAPRQCCRAIEHVGGHWGRRGVNPVRRVLVGQADLYGTTVV